VNLGIICFQLALQLKDMRLPNRHRLFINHPSTAPLTYLLSFHPQMVFLPNLSVNLRAGLCGAVTYASAQALDFLDLGQKSAFLDWKHQKVPSLVRVFYGRALLR
jgi:fluoride ion exporter CrcB/FEX